MFELGWQKEIDDLTHRVVRHPLVTRDMKTHYQNLTQDWGDLKRKTSTQRECLLLLKLWVRICTHRAYYQEKITRQYMKNPDWKNIFGNEAWAFLKKDCSRWRRPGCHDKCLHGQIRHMHQTLNAACNGIDMIADLSLSNIAMTVTMVARMIKSDLNPNLLNTSAEEEKRHLQRVVRHFSQPGKVCVVVPLEQSKKTITG